MTLGPRLELKQSQSLSMTPQLQQAIKLLQMSNIDVNEFVEAELTENPILERDDSNASKNHDGSGEIINEQNENGDEPVELETINLANNEHVTESQENALDMESYDNIWDSEPAAEPRPGPASIIVSVTSTIAFIVKKYFEKPRSSITFSSLFSLAR